MEAKRFGVKTSLLKELRLFQLTLKKKRKLYYNVEVETFAGKRDTVIFVTEQQVTLDDYSFYILKNQYRNRGSQKISLTLFGVMEMDVTFESTKLKKSFYQQM
jgi:hypothetical protein